MSFDFLCLIPMCPQIPGSLLGSEDGAEAEVANKGWSGDLQCVYHSFSKMLPTLKSRLKIELNPGMSEVIQYIIGDLAEPFNLRVCFN